MRVPTSSAMQENDYQKRVHDYVTSRSIYEKYLKKGVLSKEDFDEINARLLAKYNLSEKSVYNR